jgi:hypothetical protein
VTINEKLSMFYDLESGNFIKRWNPNLEGLEEEMSTTLNVFIKWLKGSRLKVNQSKTEMCIFHRNSSQTTRIVIDGKTVKTRDSINGLGVEFDSKLLWSNQVAKAIKKSYKSLDIIRVINNICLKPS